MIRKILVVVDDRPVTQFAIDQAIQMAQTHCADILFFGVLPHYDYPPADMLSVADVLDGAFQAKAIEETSRLLAAASAWAEHNSIHSQRATIQASDVAHAVADAAIKWHCDLIVVGIEEHNAVVRLLGGSIVSRLIFKATVPVLVCRNRPLNAKRSGHMRRPFESFSQVRELGTRSNHEPND